VNRYRLMSKVVLSLVVDTTPRNLMIVVTSDCLSANRTSPLRDVVEDVDEFFGVNAKLSTPL